jgi:hypothetical protein
MLGTVWKIDWTHLQAYLYSEVDALCGDYQPASDAKNPEPHPG